MAIMATMFSTFITCKLPCPPSIHRSHASNSFRMCYHTTTTTRRSANYGPPTWDYSYIQSLNTNYYTAERFVTRRDELKERVKNMLKNEEMGEVEKMEMIDELKRLGCSYHFEEEIMEALMDIYMKKKKSSNNYKATEEKDLYATALEFRVLRQNGFNISQDVFDGFMDGKRSGFNASLCEDTKGLLNLYESSFLSMEGETTLDLARDFSAKHLKHALEMPLRWRMPRLEARRFIDSYDKGKTTSNNAILLELAKLDFNIVQAVHLEDLRSVSRWWENSYIAERLKFSRDRVVENFFWTVGLLPNPKYVNCRRMGAKLICFICTIDDIYDVYGTLDELQLFTDTIERWDDETKVEHLPDYMRLCYLALNNFVNEVAYDILKEHGIFILHHLRKSWADLCKAYLQEAKWYASGYTPTFEEYIENAWITISCPLIFVHVFFYVNNVNPAEDSLHCLTDYHEIIRLSSMILRLANDKGTSPYEMKRGDVPKAIQCYMGETKASVNEARGFIDLEMNEIWKKMNKVRIEGCSPFSRTFIEAAMNIARMAQCMYQHGDGHGIKNFETQTRIQTVLFEPFPLINNII
ncbi:PREDICTED: (-)-alpha-terpineol synthase-like [Ipomoea nil]|uniref:(-)-alpha-terpineol synthase-like n=1 Tax=Ipomoea nil TaxID=35883 RepID=UPI000901CB27|nr:PREDICTED: (-)-alpha-terpineol synthase-like [Ipomoea nil]